MSDDVQKGILIEFDGTMGSGIAYLRIMEGDKIHRVACENAPTGRALISMFGGIEEAIGQEIAYGIADNGLLGFIADPADF